jgi:hypothetical protein
MNEIIVCPGCRRRLQVPVEVLGQHVQCPTCAETFQANLEELRQPARPAVDPPAYHPDRDQELPSPRRRGYDEADDEDFGRFRRRRRRELEPHRGNTILTLGILSVVLSLVPLVSFIGLILGAVAWGMGHQDMTAIRDDRMDPDGEGPTSAGRVCGIIGTTIGVLWVFFGCLIFLAVMLAESTRRF